MLDLVLNKYDDKKCLSL